MANNHFQRSGLDRKIKPYTYSKLNTGNEEIRPIVLMPGNAGDDTRFKICHASLIPPPETVRQTLNTEELQNTLPSGWLVKVALEGRYLFMRMGNSGTPNSWNHPDPTIDRALYASGHERIIPDYQPKFEALSYTWGPITPPETAYIVDQYDPNICHATMSIGPNLAGALTHLRYPDRIRTLWVDAVCINQSDMVERNAQVKRMASIYSLAHRVVIWLGPESADSTHALSTLQYFGEQVEYTSDECIGDAPGAREPAWWDVEYRLPYDSATWSSLSSIFSLPWFSRVWVLQEALLANKQAIVQCGGRCIPWSVLRKAIVVLAEKVGLPADLFAALGSYRTGLLAPETWSLPRLLLWGRFRQCTNPRDKIYGMLSLVSPEISRAITTDYSHPTHMVYMDALLAHIKLVKRLELLRHCQIESRCGVGLSWIPNFATERGTFFGFRKGHARQASGQPAAQVRHVSSNVLEVTGVQCASVVSVKTVPPGDINKAFRAIRQWAPERVLKTDYIAGGSSFDAFLEVITKGRVRDRYPNIPPFSTIEELRKGLLQVFDGSAAIEDVLNYFKEELRVDGTSLFETREGYLGVAQSQPKEGEGLQRMRLHRIFG